MNELIFILKFIILGSSLCAILSFYSTKSRAKRTTKELLEVSFDRPASAHELNILRDVHQVDTIDPIFTSVIEGELTFSELTSNNVTSDQVITIGDVMVQLPPHEILHYSEQTEYPSNTVVARVAAFDRKIYVLSLQDYWLGQGDDESSDQKPQSLSESGLTNSNVEIMGERPASEVEQLHFCPPKAGYGWVLSLVTVAFAFALYIDDASPSDAMIAAGIYLFIAVMLIRVWIKRSKRLPKSFTITKMRGQIKSIHNDQDSKRIRFQSPINRKKYDSYEIPESWLDKVPLDKTISFEVCAELNKVVSVQPHYSIAKSALKVNRSRNYYERFVGLSLVLSGLLFMAFLDIGKVPTMFGMLSQPDKVQITKQSDLLGTATGQRVTFKPMTAVCVAGSEKNGRMGDCDEYALFESPPTIDYQALSEPFIIELQQINESVPSQQISLSGYYLLSLITRETGQRLGAQSDIIMVNKAVVAKWAKWVERNPSIKNFEGTKKELVELWQSLKDTPPCKSAHCWSQILANDPADRGQYEHISRDKTNNLMLSKGNVIDNIIARWRKTLLDTTAQVSAHSNITIHLIDYRHRYNAWNGLIDRRGSGYRVKSEEIFEQSYLEALPQRLQKQQTLSLDFGVVSDVIEADQKTHVYIDTKYTESQFRRNLIQLALAVGLIIFGLLMGLTTLKETRTRRAGDKLQQTSWISKDKASS